MGKFKTVNELVNSLKPDYPVYCLRLKEIKKSVNFFKTNKTKIMRNDKKNKYSPYYIIHPVLRKIALNKKFKSRLNKVIKSYT